MGKKGRKSGMGFARGAKHTGSFPAWVFIVFVAVIGLCALYVSWLTR